MLAIRLFRVGKKNQPSYKIVVTDKKNAAAKGRFVEEVGFYNPLTKQRNLKGDRVKYWMSVGAKPSDTVHNMLVSDKVIEATKIGKTKKSKKAVEEKPAEAAVEVPKTESPAEETKAEETAAETPSEEPKTEEASAAAPEEEKTA